MAIVFIIICGILLLFDAYIVFAVISDSRFWVKGVILLPTIAYLMTVLKVIRSTDISERMLNLLFWLTLCVVITTIVFSVISIAGKGVGLIWHPAAKIFNILGAVMSIVWLSMALYGILAGWKRITVEEVVITSNRLPEAFKGYRIVQLSDFHIGTYKDSPKTVDEIVEKVNSLEPDLIVFTGDLVNSSSTELKEFKSVLGRLKARDGVYSVLGNHDYCFNRRYKAPDSPARQLAKVISTEKEMGWHLLRNEAIRLTRGEDTIALIGVDNAGSKGFRDRSDLPRAIRNVDGTEFKLLLSHDPSHWRREVLPTTDIDVALSGHTHAMQFKLGNWSPSGWVYPEWGGLYSEGAQKLYVSTGIGENVAFRFGAYPQIVVITLEGE